MLCFFGLELFVSRNLVSLANRHQNPIGGAIIEHRLIGHSLLSLAFSNETLFSRPRLRSPDFPSVQQSVLERVFPPQALLHSARVLLGATFYRRVLRDRADPEGDLLLYYSGFLIGPPQSELVRTRKWQPRSSEANPRSSGPDIHRFQSPNYLLPRFADTTLRMTRFSHSLSAFVASTSFNRPSLSWIKTSSSFEAFATVSAEFDNFVAATSSLPVSLDLFPFPVILLKLSWLRTGVQQVSISWFLSSIFLPSIDVHASERATSTATYRSYCDQRSNWHPTPDTFIQYSFLIMQRKRERETSL